MNNVSFQQIARKQHPTVFDIVRFNGILQEKIAFKSNLMTLIVSKTLELS
jgi:hypothetical protein